MTSRTFKVCLFVIYKWYIDLLIYGRCDTGTIYEYYSMMPSCHTLRVRCHFLINLDYLYYFRVFVSIKTCSALSIFLLSYIFHNFITFRALKVNQDFSFDHDCQYGLWPKVLKQYFENLKETLTKWLLRQTRRLIDALSGLHRVSWVLF